MGRWLENDGSTKRRRSADKRNGESRRMRVRRNAEQLSDEARIPYEQARDRLRQGNPSGRAKRIKVKP